MKKDSMGNKLPILQNTTKHTDHGNPDGMGNMLPNIVSGHFSYPFTEPAVSPLKK
jgi:hypothetical protein